MARDDKPVKLRMIDEASDVAAPVVRLANTETVKNQMDEKPIRLGPKDDGAAIKHRLDVPTREEVELRTHQPGIEVLIETEMFNADSLEQGWEASAARQNSVPWGWFVLIALLLSSAVIWSLTRVTDSEKQAVQIRQDTKTILVDEEEENREAARLVDRLDKAVRAYFATDGVEALIRQVRHPERVGSMIRTYYSGKPVFTGSLRSIKSLQPLAFGTRGNFWFAKVSLSDNTGPSIVIEVMESGDLKIDWESLVCYQPMAWDDFATQRPQGRSMDFRVTVQPDRFFSHEFANSQQWICFRLTAKNSEEVLFGYVPADSELARTFLELFQQQDRNTINLILRLSIPEGIQSRRGVIIEKIMANGWMYLDSPDSGS